MKNSTKTPLQAPNSHRQKKSPKSNNSGCLPFFDVALGELFLGILEAIIGAFSSLGD